MVKEILIILLLLALLYYYHRSQTKFRAIKKLSNLGEELETLDTKMAELLKSDEELRSALNSLNKEQSDYETKIYQLKSEHQEQLRVINCLFDENAKDYKTIDFNGLYKLLKARAEPHD